MNYHCIYIHDRKLFNTFQTISCHFNLNTIYTSYVAVDFVAILRMECSCMHTATIEHLITRRRGKMAKIYSETKSKLFSSFFRKCKYLSYSINHYDIAWIDRGKMLAVWWYYVLRLPVHGGSACLRGGGGCLHRISALWPFYFTVFSGFFQRLQIPKALFKHVFTREKGRVIIFCRIK